MSEILPKQNLWMSLVSGDIKKISYPRRLEKHIGIDPVTKMVVVNKTLLTVGVFVGRSPMCPLRLEANYDAPIFGLRFDLRNRWTIYGMGVDVRVGNQPVPTTGVILKNEHVICFGTYRLKVLQQLSDEEINQLSTELNTLLPHSDTTEISKDPFSETDFELRM